MRWIACAGTLLVVGVCLGFAPSAEPPLSEHLKPFAPYIGKTWRGEFAGSTPEKPRYDVSRWERALNGQAIRILHSVNDGAYGGESIVMWDTKRGELVAWYFTTAGFQTRGTMKFEEGKWVSHEQVTGETGGITEVKSTTELLPDGRMRTKARFLRGGEWVDAHEITYKEDAAAQVVFK